jgi:hypothetical protein
MPSFRGFAEGGGTVEPANLSPASGTTVKLPRRLHSQKYRPQLRCSHLAQLFEHYCPQLRRAETRKLSRGITGAGLVEPSESAMHKVFAVALAISLMTISQIAQAQSWGVYIGNGGGYDQARRFSRIRRSETALAEMQMPSIRPLYHPDPALHGERDAAFLAEIINRPQHFGVGSGAIIAAQSEIGLKSEMSAFGC